MAGFAPSLSARSLLRLQGCFLREFVALEEVQLVCGVIKSLALFWWHSAKLWFRLKVCVLLQVLLAWWARGQKKAEALLWQKLKYGERVEWERVVGPFCLDAGRAFCGACLWAIGNVSGE